MYIRKAFYNYRDGGYWNTPPPNPLPECLPDSLLYFTLQERVAIEDIENQAKQRQLKGQCVRYGESIQLRHTLTGKYICMSDMKTSVTENSKLRVTTCTLFATICSYVSANLLA